MSPATMRAAGRRVLVFALTLVAVLLVTALTATGSSHIRPLPLDYGTPTPRTTTNTEYRP